ncbi:MAG: family 20 glycosylhydrolase, partial [Schaedlerella sp.]|nr:family 20 glycosylhydrolase [Lachnospiraceae bacterium]MDY4202748.1 family 20 glycosylhydrolase [Schaedlerella sp.]
MKKSRFISLLLAGAMCLNLIGSMPLKAEAADTTVATYPSVQSYAAESGDFSLSENSRIVVISSSQTLQNEGLEKDLKLMSSEFTANGITEKSMDIVYGTNNSVKAGDIVVEMADVQGVDNAEEYMIEIGDYIKVTAPNEDGIFYGIRTIQKAFLGNDGKMTKGTIKDWPAVSVRSFHLDNARKFFTKDWIIAMIKDLSWQNINSLQFHFSENEGYRLQSSTLEAINGFTYPSDGYLTKQDMLDIIDVCDQYHIELVPSLDSPGHMTYVLNYLPDNYDCTSLWPSDFRSAQTFNIFEVPEAKQVLVDLFTEYADFFSKAGCKHMNIGGDEFLNNFGSMTNEQYVIVMNYFNEIAALVKSYGLTPRVWNDGVMYGSYTGYTFDSDVEICYWSGPNSSASVEKFAGNGNKVINYSDVYMYYALSSWWMSNANASGEKIYNEWHPGKLPSLSTGQQTYDYPYTDSPVLGASYALWCDVPNYMTQDAVATNLFMRTRAMAEKSWNPNTTKTYSEFETFMNTLGRVPGYDGQALPAAGQVFYEGEIGNVAVKYVDETGNEIQDSVNIYGTIGEGYEIKAPEIYGYRLTSAASVSGTYTEADQEVTFTYEKYCDKSLLKPEIEGKLPERDYIAETYAEYKEAYAAAK